MKLTIGVLAIGSLYWEKGLREAWREARFAKGAKFSVLVPIRYGRLSHSEKRRDTFTMVFSTSVAKLGQARILICKTSVSFLSDLICEAEILWGAERDKSQPDGTISSTWGCVALLTNPDSEISEDMLAGWADRVSSEKNYGQFKYLLEEGRLVSSYGLLEIGWPKLIDGGTLPLDVVLATTNEPTLEGNPQNYATPEQIALAWRIASRKYPSERIDDYFWNNRKAGITTFQDDEIERLLKGPRGCLSILRMNVRN